MEPPVPHGELPARTEALPGDSALDGGVCSEVLALSPWGPGLIPTFVKLHRGPFPRGAAVWWLWGVLLALSIAPGSEQSLWAFDLGFPGL